MRFAIAHAGKVRHYSNRPSPSEAMHSMFAAHGMTRSHAFRSIRLDAAPSWLVYPVHGLADGPDIPDTDPVAGFLVSEI